VPRPAGHPLGERVGLFLLIVRTFLLMVRAFLLMVRTFLGPLGFVLGPIGFPLRLVSFPHGGGNFPVSSRLRFQVTIFPGLVGLVTGFSDPVLGLLSPVACIVRALPGLIGTLLDVVGPFLGRVGTLQGSVGRFLSQLRCVHGFELLDRHALGGRPFRVVLLVPVLLARGLLGRNLLAWGLLARDMRRRNWLAGQHGVPGDAVGLAGLGHALADGGFQGFVLGHDHVFPASRPASARQG
jgi:hypothetical protein